MTWLVVASFVLSMQQSPAIAGRVIDESGLPLTGVTVTVKKGDLVAVTSADGTFAIAAIPAGSVLVFRLPGFTPVERKVSTASSPLNVELSIASMQQMIAVIAPVPADAASQFLTPLDVVKTAGTQADLMRALQTMPGVSQIDEGAGLFVRGGDVSEVRVLVDGVTMNHPYRYETPTGGFRGAVDPFLTEGASFTTGGFSAPFGNVLSAVVELTTLGRPKRSQVNGTAGLAGLSFAGATPFGAHAGGRIAANRTTPSVLFAVNPSPREFDRLPGGWDLSGAAYFDSTHVGHLRVFALSQADHVGVQLEKDAFIGFLHSATAHRFVAVSWDRSLTAGWRASMSAGGDFYRKTTDIGILLIDEDETHRSARGEIAGPVKGWELRAGFDGGSVDSSATGKVPERGGDFAGVSGESSFLIDHDDKVVGLFATTSRRIGLLTSELGVRADHFDQARVWTIDPRIAIRLALPGKRSLRLSVGNYHQSTPPGYFDVERGALQLSPLAATHIVAAYERGSMSAHSMMRIEAYWKRYRQLPLEDAIAGFTSTGYGSAKGIDYFYRLFSSFFDVRFSASMLRAERRWTSPEQFERYPLPDGTWRPDFAIPYSWQLVTAIPIRRAVLLAATWRVAAGRPFTPAIGAIATSDGYVPIWGAINSDHLPKYERFDLSASLIRLLHGKTTAVFFASVDNLFNRRNFFEYAYSADYSVRHPVSAASPRSFYVGCSISR